MSNKKIAKSLGKKESAVANNKCPAPKGASQSPDDGPNGTIAQSLRALGELREKAGVSGFSGIAILSGLSMSIYGWHAGRTGQQIAVVLGFVTLFTFAMILAQWFERWTKRVKS